MKSISCLQDLRDFGIYPLTGEADSLSFRILCDMNGRGADIFCEALGIRREGLADNYNSGAVASAMISHDLVPTLGVIALIKDGCHTVFSATKQGHYGTYPIIYGMSGDGEELKRAEYEWDDETSEYKLVAPHQYRSEHREDFWPWPSCCGEIQRFFCHGTGPRVGTRNVHAMSGRVA